MGGSFSEIIVDKFTKKYTAAYKRLRGAGKSKVLKYSSVIFKRWYYSALVNETTLSPSFIHSASFGARDVVTVPSVLPQTSGVHFKGFDIRENNYSLNSHPIVNDIKILLDFCVPDVELDNNDVLTPEYSGRIGHVLSISDPYYIEYLTVIAFELGLLKKTDAIYSNKAAVSNNYTLFKMLNQEESLKKIVAATVAVCSKKINETLPKKIPYISESGIVELIKKPVPIDEIFKRIFRSFGVDIEQLWDDYNQKREEASAERNAMLSSTFFLGVVLDKWFITPFGDYLKIIEPVYCFYYDFDEELGYLLDVLQAGGNVDTALFSPCAFYSFTPLGRRFYALGTGEPDKGKAQSVPVAELLGLLNFDEGHEPLKGAGVIEAKEIYSFKVKLLEDKRYWKQIDAADYNTLHELHMEIAIDFDYPLTGYSIYTDESMSPFCKYGDPKEKGKQRKADKVTLDALGLTKGVKMVYSASSGKKLELELIKRITLRRYAHYPQTVRMSKHMKALYEGIGGGS